MISMDDISSFLDLIQESSNICIASHINPDGDSIGSVLGLGLALKTLKDKNISLIYVDEIPERYYFLPYINLFREASDTECFDLLIALDCGDSYRLGSKSFLLANSTSTINVDHHVTNTRFANLNIVNEKASSTGEIVYHLINKLGIDIDTDIATCLYTAISTDTGSFKYDSTTDETLIIASELMKKGIDLNSIIVELYQSRSIERTKLIVNSFNTLDMLFQNKCGIVLVTKELLHECGAASSDVDEVINFIRDIDSIEVACVLKEVDENEIKIGLRSKKHVDVASIAKIFHGGGHVRASGCTIYDNIYNAKNLIISELEKHFR